MKYSVCLLVCAVLSACASLAAQQPKNAKKPAAPQIVFNPMFQTNLKPDKFEDPGAAAKLVKDRENVIRKLLAERRKIITTDRRAKELHQQIMKLNKELAVLMENKRAVRDLNRQLKTIDTKIKALKLKKTNHKNTKQGNKK